ncbi:uncharacterized protein LOC136034322 [Artemia franciscana]|uniref:uncharacterized protein LOC136034322 n=1 Tax=Artemia franciscana TaxID=6661 RepID=UPI0032DA0760
MDKNGVMEYQVICLEEGGTVIFQKKEVSEPGGLERWTLEQAMNLEIDIRGIPFSDLYKQAAPAESQQTMEETTQEKVAKKFCSGKDIGPSDRCATVYCAACLFFFFLLVASGTSLSGSGNRPYEVHAPSISTDVS